MIKAIYKNFLPIWDEHKNQGGSSYPREFDGLLEIVHIHQNIKNKLELLENISDNLIKMLAFDKAIFTCTGNNKEYRARTESFRFNGT